MRYEYEFDFGPNPTFLIDGWFLKTSKPVFIASIALFVLATFASSPFVRLFIPAVAIGALAVLIGVYVYRRRVARRRVGALADTVFRYVIDDEGIHYDNELGAGTIAWGFRGKVVPQRDFILLQSNEVGLLPLPVDTPDDVVAYVSERLAATWRS